MRLRRPGCGHERPPANPARQAILLKEEEEDKVVRDRFQGKWSRPESTVLTGPLKLQIQTSPQRGAGVCAQGKLWLGART